MASWAKHLRQALRATADAAALVLCWSLWIALAVLLCVQIGIAVSHELAVPGFILRAFESRLNASHLQARFGRATFNPAGGILVENLRLSLPEFSEPVAQADAVYVELNPWSLLAGSFEARRVHASGLKLFVPAMVTPSGRSEEILTDLEFSVVPHENEIEVEHLTAKLAGVSISAHGGFTHPPAAALRSAVPVLETVVRGYIPLTRQLLRIASELTVLEEPRVEINVSPSNTRGGIAAIVVRASRISLPQFHVTGEQLTASTRVPLLGDTPAMSVLSLDVKHLQVGAAVAADVVHARLRGGLNPARLSFLPAEVEFSVERVSALAFAVDHITGRLVPESWTRFHAELVARTLGEPASIQADVDLGATTAKLGFSGTVAPALLDPIGATMKVDLHRFIGFGKPLVIDAQANFASGWKFQRVSGHLDVRDVDAYHVQIDSAHGEFDFDGRHFVARHALARLGDNFATGSFEQDLKTREFRFLLEGRLRPLAISGWFREWWPNIFRDFEFPLAPPDASVDVAGRWFSGGETTVFLFADSASPIVRGVQFDQARTLLFIRPHFLDGLEAYGTRGASDVRGTFVRRANPTSYEWSEFTLDFVSSLDLAAGAKLLGPSLADQLSPYWFETPPSMQVSGRFTGPGADTGPHQFLKIQARTSGAFSAFQFPARNLAFEATLRDDELLIENLKADVASGTVSGRASLSGSKAARQLGFDAQLHNASLGEAVTAVVNFAAARRGEAQKSAEKILPGKSAVKLDLAVSADGKFDDPYSFTGSGNASLAGAGLGEVRLLGMLSELLNFTALRFTAGRADFKVMGSKISFPAVSVTGSNSAIEGHGDYYLDRRELDFNVRVYPFQESKSLFQNVVGAVLTPLSAALEVKLTGPIDQPKWAFLIGPTNFFRTLTGPSSSSPSTPLPQAKPSSPAESADSTVKTH